MPFLVATVPSGATPITATPSISPATGVYGSAQTCVITDATPTATIYYTIDGSTPTTSSPVYTGSFSVTVSKTVNAIAQAPGYLQSGVATANYVIQTAASAPTYSPTPGRYSITQTVTMSSATSGASIYYTIDGTTPTYPVTGTTTLYTGGITVSSTETFMAIAVKTGFRNSSVSAATYTISAGGTQYLGMNLAGLAYYTSEIPFLNLMKQGGGNQAVTNTCWFTNTSNGSGDLNTDASGYPKSLTGVSGTVYSYAGLLVLVNVVGNAPTQTYPFPIGPYTFQFSGKGIISITGTTGSITSISNTGTGTSTYSGTTINSTSTTGVTTAVFTVTSPSTIGFTIHTTSIPDNTDWPRGMALVESDLWSTARENGGTQIFHPLFKNYLIELGVKRLRFMDWGATNNLNPSLNFTTPLSSGAMGATATSVWNNPTGTYTVLLNTGQQISSGLIFNSTSVTFGTAVTTAASANAWYVVNQYWSNRSNWGDSSYCTQKAVPVEVMLELANELGVDAWVCVPLGADSTYWTGMANLAYNGAGSTIPGFAGLNSGLKCYVEFSNELFNFATSVYAASNAYALVNFASATFEAQSNWYGSQVATIADAWYAIYGSQFASRVCVSMGGQFTGGNGPFYMIQSMNTPYWTSAAYTHHIGAYHFAPYFSTGYNGAGLTTSTAITFTAPPTGTGGNLIAALAAGTYLITFSDNEVRNTTVTGTGYNFTASLVNATSGTLTTALAAGTYLLTFNSYTSRAVTQATSSTAVSWTGAVTNSSTSVTISASPLTWTGALVGAPTSAAQVGDVPAMLISSNPLNTFFAMAYTNVYQGLTYASVPSFGFMGEVIYVATTSVIGSITGQAWGPGGAQQLPILGYESGSSWVSGAGQTAYLNLITEAHRDPRIALLYYDPSNELYTTYGYTAANGQPGFLPAMVTAGFTSINQFNDVGGITQYGEWGAAESIMQTLSPLSAAPYKAQGLADWIAS